MLLFFFFFFFVLLEPTSKKTYAEIFPIRNSCVQTVSTCLGGVSTEKMPIDHGSRAFAEKWCLAEAWWEKN